METLIAESDLGLLCLPVFHRKEARLIWVKLVTLIFFLLSPHDDVGRSAVSEPQHEISNNVVSATSKGSDKPAHTRSLIRALTGCLNIS